MADYKINESGEIIFPKGRKVPDKKDSLWVEYIKLEYEVLNNHHNPIRDPVKIARYNELKKQLNIDESNKALDKAREKIKNEMISSDKSSDNSVLYAAIAKFKKRDE